MLRAVIGSFIAAVVISGLWRVFTDNLGPMGGILAAIVLTGTMWFLNHYIGLIPNEKNCAFIDMGIGVGTACIVRDIIISGNIKEILSSIPTLILVIIGGTIGGVLSVFLKKDMMKVEDSSITMDTNNSLNLRLNSSENGVVNGN